VLLANFEKDGTVYVFGWVLGAVVMVDWLGKGDHCVEMCLGRDVEGGNGQGGCGGRLRSDGYQDLKDGDGWG
jgi:hypothetical protein